MNMRNDKVNMEPEIAESSKSLFDQKNFMDLKFSYVKYLQGS